MSHAPAYVDHEKNFQYMAPNGVTSVCEVDLFLREDLAGNPIWGVVLITQKPEEKQSIIEDSVVIGAEVYMRKFLQKDLSGVLPEKLIWLAYLAPTRECRFQRMERIYFKQVGICHEHRHAIFPEAIWHRYSQGVVEKLMGRTWAQMCLPELRPYRA